MKFLPRSLKMILGLVALIILALFLPSAANAWSLNFANANLARAASLPSDAPVRAVLLAQAQSLPPSPRGDLARARGWIENDQPQRALAIFNSTGDALRKDLIAQFLWGNVAWSQNDPTTAFTHWRNAGAMEYFMQAALRNLLSNQWQAAEQAARIAIGIAPDNSLAHYFLGDALSRQASDNEAMSELKRAQELIGNRDNEFLSTILTRQGEILAGQGKIDQAIQYFDQTRQVAPLDARPRTDYARIIFKTDPGAAEKLLTQVIADSPWYTDAYIALADFAEARGDFAGAEQWYQMGLIKNLNDARLNFPLGQFYARQKKYDQSKVSLTLALKSETRADVLQAISATLSQVDQK